MKWLNNNKNNKTALLIYVVCCVVKQVDCYQRCKKFIIVSFIIGKKEEE